MNPQVLKHFQNPQNVGEITGADGVGKAGDPACGAVINVFIDFDGDRIGRATFQASGSSAVIAAGSALTESIRGASWKQAAATSPVDMEKILGAGNDAAGRTAINQASLYAVESLHLALEDSLGRGSFPRAAGIEAGTVLVAMSGGVDSSTACLLKQRSGQQVIGVTMRLWSDPACDDESGLGCCSPRAIREARAVCHKLGLPHLTVDYSAAFEAEVVENFTSEYMAGRTPNPCVRCNGRFRFPALVALADRLGAGKVATGHYARIVEGSEGLKLARGLDQRKDQSYMLATLDAKLLKRLEFPLGWLEKTQTRLIAREGGLAAHSRPESQDVCFIPDNDYRRFMGGRLKSLPGEGEIVDGSGNRMGVHAGYHNYTVGQRKGLGLSAPEPMYVIATVPDENRVVVGRSRELAVTRLEISEVNSFRPAKQIPAVDVQVRYNSATVKGRLVDCSGKRWQLDLDEPLYGVAPGQYAVMYLDGAVVGCGAIDSR